MPNRKLEIRVDWGKEGMKTKKDVEFNNTRTDTESQSCSYTNQPSGPAGTGTAASELSQVVQNHPSEGCEELVGCGNMHAQG